MELKIESVRHGNHIILIDDEDYDKIKGYTWSIALRGRLSKTFYISGYKHKSGRNAYRPFLHRLIMDCPDGFCVDHINGNALDNRKQNLRICTQQQNSFNSNKQNIKTSSVYKGVTFDKARNKYQAQIKINYKHKIIGRYETEDQAAIAYNIAALENFGEYAKLNNVMAMKRIM